MEKRALRYWVALNRVSGIGAARLNALLQHFGDLEAAWRAPDSQLERVINNRPALEALQRARRTADIDADLDAVAKIGARVLTLHDDDYPALLRQIGNPPPVLYIRGSIQEVDQHAVGIVGTRSPTDYGLQAARSISVNLVKAGVTIISGLAKGIDTAAHKSTIAMNGRTFALLGHGIDTVYPRENEALALSIAQHGAVITEFPIGMRADAGNFPMRNRLISGLSLGVVVVEAGAKSGALGTARHALEQNREVFAIPGSIFSKESAGANLLIQAGEAKLITNVTDILDELALDLPLFQQTQRLADAPQSTAISREALHEMPPPAAPPHAALPDELNDTERAILSALSATPLYIDEICAASGLSAARVTSTLTVLELNGYVQQPSSRCFVLAHS